MNKVKAPCVRSHVSPIFKFKLKGGYSAGRESFNFRVCEATCKPTDTWIMANERNTFFAERKVAQNSKEIIVRGMIYRWLYSYVSGWIRHVDSY